MFMYTVCGSTGDVDHSWILKLWTHLMFIWFYPLCQIYLLESHFVLCTISKKKKRIICSMWNYYWVSLLPITRELWCALGTTPIPPLSPFERGELERLSSSCALAPSKAPQVWHHPWRYVVFCGPIHLSWLYMADYVLPPNWWQMPLSVYHASVTLVGDLWHILVAWRHPHLDDTGDQVHCPILLHIILPSHYLKVY